MCSDRYLLLPAATREFLRHSVRVSFVLNCSFAFHIIRKQAGRAKPTMTPTTLTARYGAARASRRLLKPLIGASSHHVGPAGLQFRTLSVLTRTDGANKIGIPTPTPTPTPTAPSMTRRSLSVLNHTTSSSTSVTNGIIAPASCFHPHQHQTQLRGRPFSSFDDEQYDGVMTAEVAKLVRQHAHQPQTSANLETLMKTGRGEFLHRTYRDGVGGKDGEHAATEKILIQVAGFLRHELPIRLAHRIVDLNRVPLMKDMPSVKTVRDLYLTSFLELVSVDKEIQNEEQEEAFSRLLEGIYERHAGVLVQMARGAFELRAAIKSGAVDCPTSAKSANLVDADGTTVVEFDKMDGTHDFLDRFYISRIGIRVLIGQYLSLRQPPVENYVGIICSRTSPYEIVRRAIDDASFMCTRKYGDAPEVIITGRLDLTFPYVPTHLHYIMLELLKNSMRATVDWHGVDADFPPIKVIIADGNENEDVVIKVSDEGGGIPRSNMERIWSYLFTTADPAIQEGMVAFNENVDHSVDSPLAGLGYGLPISRSYARYFGGDLSIMSMEGFGTDAFVYLTRLGNTREPLPI